MNNTGTLEIDTMTDSMLIHMRGVTEAGMMTGTITESLNIVIAAILMMTITPTKITDSEVTMMIGAGIKSHAALSGLLTATKNYLNITATSKIGMSVSMAQENCPGTALTVNFHILSATTLKKARLIDSLRIYTNTNLLQGKKETKWKSCII